MQKIVALPLLLVLLTGSVLSGQIFTFSKFPFNNQIYQRDVTLNKALITISGTVKSVGSIDFVKVTILEDDVLLQDIVAAVTLENDNTGSFLLRFYLPANRRRHILKFSSHTTGALAWQEIKAAQNVVAGDILIINGQSNAQALAAPAPEDIDTFTRSYYLPYGWGTLNLSFPGLWGARLAKRLSDYADIPIAVFNQAVGALPINTYLRNENAVDSGNYGQLLKRIDASGSERRIRAAFWFHGEADGWGTSINSYKASLLTLSESWREDYKIEHTFLFQKRYQSCTSPLPYVLEAQRQIADESPDISIMSTTNARHDSCHFYYEGGYQSLGDRMFELVATQLYNADLGEVAPPDVSKAWMETPSQVIIQVKNTKKLEQIGWPWMDFRTEGEVIPITGGSVENNLIRLNLAAPAKEITGVSYLPHPGEAPHWITNAKGVGLLGFYNAAITNRPVSVALEPKHATSIRVWPNPATDMVQLDVSAIQSPVVAVVVYDAMGKIVANYTVENNPATILHLPTANLLPGLYIGVLKTANGQNISTKFVR